MTMDLLPLLIRYSLPNAIKISKIAYIKDIENENLYNKVLFFLQKLICIYIM